MIGAVRTIKQKAGRFRKLILKKAKELFWDKKNNNFEDADQNWET